MPYRPRITNFSTAQREANPIARSRQETRQGNGRVVSDGGLEVMERDLSIDDNALEAACTKHPDLMYRVASEVALQRSRRDAGKKALEEKEADMYVRLRHDAAVGGERITEAEIKANITLDAEYKRLTNELLVENEKLARWEALRDAYSQRSYMLRELVSLYLARYYGSDPARSAENNIRNMATEQLHQARRERSRQRTER